MSSNIDFLRFSAYSMKDLITRKLSQNTDFTDQIYQGSNMSILIDIVSYMYQCLVYLLNNAASESMFADTQIYENINRLVKLIGYNPRGIVPTSAQFFLNNKVDNSESTGGKYRNFTILKYSALDTKLTDSNGKKIYFSLSQTYKINDDINFEFTLINGKWKYYNKTLIASGTEFETFILENLRSNTNEKQFVSGNYIDVYVEKQNGQVIQFIKSETELFLSKDNYNIYNNSAKIFNIRLNENKQYEIKFGNGKIGEKLDSGDILHIFYLESNGFDGEITKDQYDNSSIFEHNKNFLGISEELYSKIFEKSSVTEYITDLDNAPKIFIKTSSNKFLPEESVDSIRYNAPNWFKTGNKLISNDDYVYYIKNKYSNDVIDLVCQNNFEYMSTFYKWLFELGIKYHNDPKYYLNSSRLLRNDFMITDAADSNNIYLWVQLYNKFNEITKNEWIADLNNKKILTTNIVLLEPLKVNFALCAAAEEHGKKYFDNQIFDENNETYLEITVNDNNIYNTSQIKTYIMNIFNNYFNKQYSYLGSQINYNIIYNAILGINGIINVRTIWIDKDDINAKQPRIFNGLSFATWTDSFIDKGDDLEISTINKVLEPFQFPNFYSKSLDNKIKVIKKSINNINKLKI